MNGCVFNLQRYSVHDGPGIRTIVFLKGCPLHCTWCSNPESQDRLPQLGYKSGSCIGAECLLCQKVCEKQAVFYPGSGPVVINHSRCTQCQKCAAVCPSQALTTYGKMWDVKELLDEVEKDAAFYSRSGGGLTVSGGEPLMQPEFTKELLQEAKKRHIHTAIETTGYASWETAKEIFSLTDYILYDLKLWDENKHLQYTGVDNQIILENFRRLCIEFPDKPVKARTPVIPDVNDTSADLLPIKELVSRFPNASYELLKYHRFGVSKYETVGRTYEMSQKDMDDQHFQELKSLVSFETGGIHDENS